jgi:hypothetical protein
MKANASSLVNLRIPADDGALTRALAELDARMAAWAAALARMPEMLAASRAQNESRKIAEQAQAPTQQPQAPAGPAVVEAVKREAVEAQKAAPQPTTKLEAARPDAVKAEAQQSEAVKAESAKADAAKAQVVKTDAARAEAVKADAARAEAVKTDAARPETVKADAARPQVFKTDSARSETVKAVEVEAVKQAAVVESESPIKQKDIAVDFAAADTEPVARPVSPDDDESLLAGLDPEAVRAIRVQRRLLDGQKTLRQLVEEYRAAGLSEQASRSEKKSWWSRGKK